MIIWDSLISFLLIVGIIVALKLYRRIQKLKGLSDNVSRFLKRFGYYAQQISGHVAALKRATEEGNLGERLPDMLALHDDFDVLLEHGEKLASRLDSLIERAQEAEQNLKNTLEFTQPPSLPLSPKTVKYEAENIPDRYRSGVSLLTALRGVR